jgi:hypothetical protein
VKIERVSREPGPFARGTHRGDDDLIAAQRDENLERVDQWDAGHWVGGWWLDSGFLIFDFGLMSATIVQNPGSKI